MNANPAPQPWAEGWNRFAVRIGRTNPILLATNCRRSRRLTSRLMFREDFGQRDAFVGSRSNEFGGRPSPRPLPEGEGALFVEDASCWGVVGVGSGGWDLRDWIRG